MQIKFGFVNVTGGAYTDMTNELFHTSYTVKTSAPAA
jgi:hypothetical protein